MVKRVWRHCAARIGFAWMLVGLGLVPNAFTASVALADIDGNTYTSPQFGFSVSWTDAWYVVDEKSESFDAVLLSDGITYAAVSGLEDLGGDPKRALIEFFAIARTEPSHSDVVRNPNTGVTIDLPAAGNWVSMQVSYTVTDEDGSTYEVVEFDAARTLVPGESVVFFSTGSLAEYFADEAPAIEELLAGVEVGSSPEVDVLEREGEPAPVFASGRWRVAVATAALQDEFEDLGLTSKPGKAWLVVVADVTNWSADGGTFVGREFRLRAGTGKPVKPAPNSTGLVTQSLGLAPFGQELTLAIGAGETARVALVFSIPTDERDLILIHGDQALPLDDAMAIELEASTMPDLAAPPVVTQAVLESASDGRTLRVQPTGQSNSQRLRLLGVDPPADGACYGKEAEKVLDALVGRPVLIEEDSQIAEGGGTPARYVWLVNEDGTRTLINASLVATGRAAAAELPADARFGGWLQESERMAKAAPMGQWAECGSGNGTGSAAPQATPSAQSTAVPTASPTARATADPDRIVLNLTTNDFAFSPVKLTVPANTHVTLRLVNNGGASHSFTIEELGVGTRAIGPGGTESVEFTTGEPGLYVFFCAMPGHKEQGMVGTLIVVES